MTAELERAMRVTRNLPEAERVALARFLLPDGPGVDAEWDRLVEASRESLDALADELLADDAAGRTASLDPDAL